MIVLVNRITRFGTSLRIVIDKVILSDDQEWIERMIECDVTLAETGIQNTDDNPFSVVSRFVQIDEVYLLKLILG